MRDNVLKKGLVLVIIMLFIGAGVVPSISGNQTKKTADFKQVNEYGNILPAANADDTIEAGVPNSSPVPPPGRKTVSRDSLSSFNGVILDNVPTSRWTYGCAPTAAGMLFGYYDRVGYSNMYTGPTNKGVCPLHNLGQCHIIATKKGSDGITCRGHVDDYWISFGSQGPDPWEENGWDEHSWKKCTADFLGTSQWKYDINCDHIIDAENDGSTTCWYDPDGEKLNDAKPKQCVMEYCPGSQCTRTSCCHGCKLFAESRGYYVTTNYNQLTDTSAGNPSGFTFSDFQHEIDSGHPVITHWISSRGGHTMLGVGYDSSGVIYFHDAWDNQLHSCHWNGEYSHDNYQLKCVTVIHLVPSGNSPPDISSESPSNGNREVGVWLSELSVTIDDPEDDTFDWSIETSPDIGSSSGSGETDGMKTCSVSGLHGETAYKWYVNVTDSIPGGSDSYTREVYTFTTEKNNVPDAPTNPSPSDGADGVSISPTLSVFVSDPNGGNIDVTFYNADDDSVIGTVKEATSGNRVSVDWTGLDYDTTYSWYAVSDDGEYSNSSIVWHFTALSDEEKPQVSIYKPKAGLYIRGSLVRPYLLREKPLILGDIEIGFKSSDDVSGVDYVELRIDVDLKKNFTMEQSDYTWSWNTTTFGLKTVKVISHDNAGNQACDEITVWKFF